MTTALRRLFGGQKILDSAFAAETRRRDELPLYDPLHAIYGPLLRGHQRVLDVGCGTGRYFRHLTDADLVVGVDPSPAMLAEARGAVGVERLRRPPVLVVGTANSIPVLGPFDLVFSIGVVGQVVPFTPALVGYLRSFGGTLVLSVLADGDRRHFCPAADADVRKTQPSNWQKVAFNTGVSETFHLLTYAAEM